MSVEVKLEPFLKCRIVELEFSKYPHRDFLVSFDAAVERPEAGHLYGIKRMNAYVEPTAILGKNLLYVHVVVMHSKEALIRISYSPEGYDTRELWVPREQIEWH